MKTRIYFGLWAVLVGICLSVQADDNPSQAAARAILELKLKELDSQPSQPMASPAVSAPAPAPAPASAPVPVPVPVPAPPSSSTLEQPDKSAIILTAIVAVEVVTPPPQPVTNTPAAVPIANVIPTAPTRTRPTEAPKIPKPTPAVVVTKLPSPPAKPKPAAAIITIYGTAYKNAHVEKIQTNGIIISYEPAGGGVAMSKVYFEDLSYEVQQHYKIQRPRQSLPEVKLLPVQNVVEPQN